MIGVGQHETDQPAVIGVGQHETEPAVTGAGWWMLTLQSCLRLDGDSVVILIMTIFEAVWRF